MCLRITLDRDGSKGRTGWGPRTRVCVYVQVGIWVVRCGEPLGNSDPHMCRRHSGSTWTPSLGSPEIFSETPVGSSPKSSG